MDETQEKPTLKSKFRHFVRECVRVIKVTKKPDTDEFKSIVKISALGMAVIGIIGFIINIINQLFFK